MVSILLIAGLLHLIIPTLFLPAMPHFLPFPILLVYLTGLIELILAGALLYRPTRKNSAIILTVYLIILLIPHIYVSYYGIEIFTISSKALLWLRTVFQIPLIFWAWALRKA